MWRGWDKTADEKRRLCYLLSRRTSLASWSGQEVHRAIASYLSSGQAMEQVIHQTRERMREQFRCSRSRLWSEPGQAKKFGLLEHFYDEHLDDDVVRERWEHVQMCLESMGQSNYLQDAMEAKESGRLVFIENPDELDFDLMAFKRPDIGDFKIFAQADFVVEYEDHTTCIIDWKTGRPPAHGQDFVTEQLGLYALWASEKLGLDLDSNKIEPYEVYLPSEQSRGDVIGPGAIQDTLKFVSSSVRELREVLRDPETNLAHEQDFVPRPSTAKCGACEFRAVCSQKATE